MWWAAIALCGMISLNCGWVQIGYGFESSSECAEFIKGLVPFFQEIMNEEITYQYSCMLLVEV